VPNSRFDERGECFWCQHDFPNYRPQGEHRLQDLLNSQRRPAAPADCLVGLSGGKDSTYALLALQKRFGMRVEAFTYVHEGTADFALQNARRVCAGLGVAHHLVSLPHQEHLNSFKAFFTDWQKTGNPLSAAMTCVACKHLHILGTGLAHRRCIPTIVWAACPLETPPFIPAQSAGSSHETRSTLGMAASLARSLCAHPGFTKAFLSHFSTCVQGCLAFRPGSGYLQRIYPSVRQVNFFDYCRWDGAQMRAVLRAETRWTIPASVGSDWHSDCVFNVFKEYMFQKMYGVSYTDAFLSNQIRYGLITRDQAVAALRQSKQYFARELPKALTQVGLAHLQSQTDPSCFDVPSG
jgi:hypothetical protein